MMDGKDLSLTQLNLLLYGELDPDNPRVPQEIKDTYPDIIKPTLNTKGERIGKIMIFGTSGSEDKNNLEALKEVFYNPENYKDDYNNR